MRIICMFKGHYPNRRRVWHDGSGFRGACRHCGKSIVRMEAGWVVTDQPASPTGTRDGGYSGSRGAEVADRSAAGGAAGGKAKDADDGRPPAPPTLLTAPGQTR